MIVVTENTSLLRDSSTGALLSNDNRAREKYRKNAEQQKKIEKVYLELEELRDTMNEINIVKGELSEIKQLLISMRSTSSN